MPSRDHFPRCCSKTRHPDLNLGEVMRQKSGSKAVVSLQLQTTPDLSASFTNHDAPVGIAVDLLGDKQFPRIRSLGPQ
jgi:hypothetical protein